MDDYVYRPELPHSSATEDSNENRIDLLQCSKMREFSSCFSSYAPSLSSTVSPTLASASLSIPLSFSSTVVIEPPHHGSTETQIDNEGPPQEYGHKHEREHHKRFKNWTRAETLKPIQARTDIDGKFVRAGKKSELWDHISELLQRENFARESQQCKYKWEKLCASYKEVRDGLGEKENFFFYDEMLALVSGNSKKREREGNEKMRVDQEGSRVEDMELNLSQELGTRVEDSHRLSAENFRGFHCAHTVVEESLGTKRENGVNNGSVVDIQSVQELMDSYLIKQRKFFAGLLDEVERREQLKEKRRQEKEDRWRAEECEQRQAFTKAMIILTQRLLGETANAGGFQTTESPIETFSDEHGQLKKRLKKSYVL